ncbi:MAG: hypothetical protein OEV40_27960 [Acidimicrobiia bacterium]|nr:hypothetical protein [Acidimicrobiia bacterium]
MAPREHASELRGQDASTDVWSRHPDALILSTGGDVVDANPTTEQLFGHPRSWLVGKPTSVLVPRSILASSSLPVGAPYRARRRDGGSFVAIASLVAGAPRRGHDDLIVVRDVTGLAESLQPDVDGGSRRVSELEARERALDEGKERLTQTLFGAGIALRSCLQTSPADVSRECIERVLDLLDHAIADLDGG